MKRSIKQILKRKHPVSEYLLVSLMAVILLFAAIIINISNFFINKLLPIVLMKKFRKAIHDNQDINKNAI